MFQWLVLLGVLLPLLWINPPPTNAQTSPPPSQQPVTEIRPGITIERELRGGQTHTYRVGLRAGDYLYAVADQQGIDLAVVLFDPDGKQMSVTDSPNDRWGAEPILALASRSGSYRVEIRGPTSATAVGKYEIRVSALRAATEIDKAHVKAQRTFEEGYKLLATNTSAARRSAIEKLKEASSSFKLSGDTYRQALAIRAVGRGSGLLGDFRTAAGHWREALELVRAIKEQRLEAGLETDLGFAHDTFGDIDEALAHYFRALALARDLKNTPVEASVLNNIGKIHNDLADWGTALEFYLQALPLFRSISNTRAEGITLNNIGISYSLAGEQDKARTYLMESLELIRASGDKNAEAYTLSNIGSAFGRDADYQKALSYYEQAQTIQTQTGNLAQQAETLDLMGNAFVGLGEYQKAIEHHQRALAIHRSSGNLRREAITLNNLGRANNLLKKPASALENFEQSLAIFRKIQDLDNAADALEGRARAELAQGTFEAARRSVEESLSLVEMVRVRAGSQDLRSSYLASVEKVYEFYIELLMQQHRAQPTAGLSAEALKASERGRARSFMEMLAESRVAVRRGVDPALVERERTLANLLNAKAQRHIQLLARKANADEIAILTREISKLEDEYQQVQVAIRKNSPAYASLTQPQPLGLTEIQKQLDPDTLLLEYSLGDERSYLWLVSASSLQSFELQKREEIQRATRAVYDALTTRSQPAAGETATQKSQRIAKADMELMTSIPQLSKMVLGPVASELKGKRLVIVADDALQYVPFAALSLSPESVHPLINDHEVIMLPSASALAVQRENLARRKPAPKGIAVIADPVFSSVDDRLTQNSKTATDVQDGIAGNTRIIEHIPDDPTGKTGIRRLRFTRQEAEQILAVAPRRTNLRALDFKASRATATSAVLGSYRYVHFATHGYIDSERPDLSAIVLSLVDREGNAQDGFLRAHDIYNLDLPAELVVLSACQTGLGKNIKGEGLVGLTRGFMYAGARRVVVSLWNVNDKATAELMRLFYRGMLKQGLTPAAALRQAQSEMSRHSVWHSPYYWAAFVLQGDWN
jgi:CHAT domain-containing protein/tetratricopeptide (TPR) repeat protein